VRNRPWIDIIEPNVSGVRVDVDLINQTLSDWGGWNEVESEFRWKPFAEAVTGLPAVSRDAAMRLRGFCLTHFGPQKPVFGVPKSDYWCTLLFHSEPNLLETACDGDTPSSEVVPGRGERSTDH
jgi:hypothetical protein